MRKIYKIRFMLAFFVAMLISIANMQAANYDLWICGVQVTDANKNDLVAAINGVSGCTASGTIKFISEANTLVLNNAVINVNKEVEAGIKSTLYNDLIISLKGTGNTINMETVNANGMLLFSSAIFISGSSDYAGLTVNAKKANSRAIVFGNQEYRFFECIINANGNLSGITCYAYMSGGLKIVGSDVTATGSDGCIYGFDSITLDKSTISSPAGAYIPADDGNVVDASGNIVKGTLKIVRSGVTTYPIKICGKSITNVNKDNLSYFFDGVAGTVKYNPDNKTLTLNGATINIQNGANAIQSTLEGLIIDLTGNNNVNSDDYATIRLEKTATIKGGGTLNVSQTSGGWALFTYGTSLTIENCKVNATSSGRGITCNNSNVATLNIKNATVTSKGTADGSITHFANINLNDCGITQPIGAVISQGSDSFYAVRDVAGNIIKELVKIEPVTSYDLWIWGTQVNNANSNYLATFAGATQGTMTYDNSTKTLKLTNIEIDKTGDRNIIKSSINGLIIEVVGENSLKANAYSLIELNSNSSILGSGSLYVENSRDDYGINLNGSGITLTVKDCSLNVISPKAAIRGTNAGNLLFNNATVTAKGTSTGSIIGFYYIDFTDCYISHPSDAVYNFAQKAICYADGTIVKEEVKIESGVKYDLWIWDTQVTSNNYNNLGAITGVTQGTITYDNSTKTLKLNNVKFDKTGDNNIIKSSIEELIIEVVGENSLKGNSYSIIDLYNTTTILGSGSIYVENCRDDCGIKVYGNSTTLTIKDCNMNIISPKEAIRGTNQEALVFDSVTLTAKGAYLGPVYGFESADFINCYIAEPEGAMFYPYIGAICYGNGAIINDELKILPGEPPTLYDLWIWGTQVTNVNCGNLGDVAGVTQGTITYDNSTKTLKLDNVKFDKTGDNNLIKSSIDGLKIEVIGENSLKANAYSLIDLNSNSSIIGSGSLYVENSRDDYGINVDGNGNSITLTIKNCNLKVISPKSGIHGQGYEKLIVDNVTVSATGTSMGSIKGFTGLNFIGCLITKPAGAVYDTIFKAVCYAEGGIVKEEVIIEPGEPVTFYNLWIWGTQVSDYNCSNLGTFAGVTQGTITYDNSTKTLKLNNVKLDKTGEKNVIKSSIDGLKIEVVGENSLKANAWSLIDVNSNSTIQGNGTLNIENSRNDYGINVYGNSITLTIKDCNMNVISPKAAINGTTTESIVFNNTKVTAKGTSIGSVVGFKNANFINCSIAKPAGAVFNPTQQAVCYADGTIVKEEVVIEPGSGIDEFNAHNVTLYPNPVEDILKIEAKREVSAVRIYNMDGTIVSQVKGDIREINLSHLPAGIYLVRVVMEDGVSTHRIIKR